MAGSRNIYLFALLLLMVSACSEPASTEIFLQSSKAVGGVYSFELELDDTDAAYDVWFCARTLNGTVNSLPLTVQWVSPEGKRFSESVYMRTVSPRGEKELYRKDLVPAVPGKWQLSVRPSYVGGDLCGMGVVCEKKTANNGKTRHGTR